VEALLAFGAALLALRLAGDLATRYRLRRAPHLAAWSGAMTAYAGASAALAWGAAAGWGEEAFRTYYILGGLATAPLLGLGSLLLTGRRWALPAALFYLGIALGVGLATPLHGELGGTAIPAAQQHFDFFPARLVAVLGNGAGTLAVVAIALATIRRRPLPNVLILAGVVAAAAGSGLAGLGVAATAAFIAVGVVFLYAGFRLSAYSKPEKKLSNGLKSSGAS
jgi:hypothetical protein